jgi:glutamyl endopeptidase
MLRLSTPGRQLRALVVGTAVVALAFTGGAPAGAAPALTPAAAPDAPLADDGSVSLAPAPAPADVQGVSGFSGTGFAGGGTADDPANPTAGTPAGARGIDSIIGADNRTRVNPTTVFPVRAIVQIIRTGTSTVGCTGWLYGPNIVATTGHCVHPGSGQNGGGPNGFYPQANFTIIPGRNFPSNPFGACGATRLTSVNGWTQSGNPEYDYGTITLNCSVGNTTGWWGFWWQSASLTGTPTTVSGYPCDKTFGEQWRHAGQTVQTTQVRRVFYLNDTFACQAGSPVYQNRAAGSSFCVGWCVMAIHAGGGTSNSGTRITEGVFNNLINWRNTA